MIDGLKSRLNDPCITCHWSSVGSDTNTSATLHITSPEVGHLARLVSVKNELHLPRRAGMPLNTGVL